MKTYDMLGLWRDAEDVLRRDVVRSFIKKVGVLLCYLLGIKLIVAPTDRSPW